MTRTWVALLYSIILGPQRRVQSADLIALAEGLGYDRPRTLLATGNLIFEAAAPDARAVEAALEPAFAARLGRQIDIIVRAADRWPGLMRGCPFPEAAAASPAQVSVRVMRQPVGDALAVRLEAWRTGDECLAVVDGDLWLHLPHGTSTSGLVTAITPARAGTGTFRNWNTVRRIGSAIHG